MKIRIINETDYNTSDLKKIIRLVCDELMVKEDKKITIKYRHRPRGTKQCWGQARLPLSYEREGEWSMVTLPRVGVDPVDFARVVKHELRHNLGVKHRDMTVEQKYCTTGCDWAKGMVIRRKSTVRLPDMP